MGESILERDRVEQAQREAEWRRQECRRGLTRDLGIARARTAKLDRLIDEAEQEAGPKRARAKAIGKALQELGPRPTSAAPWTEDDWRRRREELEQELGEINAGMSAYAHSGLARWTQHLGRGLAALEKSLRDLRAERDELARRIAALEEELAALA